MFEAQAGSGFRTNLFMCRTIIRSGRKSYGHHAPDCALAD